MVAPAFEVMKGPWNKIVRALVMCFVSLLILRFVAIHLLRLDRPSWDLRLKELAARKATRDEVVAELGLGTHHRYYEKGVTNWHHLESFLRGRPDIAREIGTSSRVIYSTTADTMTWIILDNQSRITNYYTCAQ